MSAPKLEILREADYVLNACGRPMPPEGFRYVDLPRALPYHFNVNSAPGTPFQQRLANNAATLFLTRGIGFGNNGVGVRVRWPSGRFFNQTPASSTAPNAFPVGFAGNMFALDKEEPIERDAKISIEFSGVAAGIVDITFWGVLRYMLRESEAIGGRGSSYTPANCLVGYPALPSAKIDLATMADPVETLENVTRYICGPNQNVMAPEVLLGNQCTPETPAGYFDDSFTFFSDAIPVVVDKENYTNTVIVPGRAGEYVVIDHIRILSTPSNEVPFGVVPTFALRLPSGYSITGGDQVPVSVLFRWPTFPMFTVKSGDRLVIDMADINGTGGHGTITNVMEFNGRKRTKQL